MFHLYPVRNHSSIRFGGSWALQIFQIVFFLIGLPLLLFGLLVLLADGYSKETAVLTGIGAFLFALSAAIASYRKKLPKSVVFDPQKEEILITSSASKVVTIGFGEIDSFSISYFREHNYLVTMKLKNGSIWDLVSCASNGRAAEILRLLKDKINTASRNTTLKPALDSQFKITEYPTHRMTLISWKERFKISDFFWTLLLAGGLFLLLSAAVDVNWFGLKSPVIFGLLFSLSVLLILFRLIQTRLLTSALLIDSETIRFGKAVDFKSFISHSWKPLKIITTKEVIRAAYSLDSVYGAQSLIIEDRKAAELSSELRDGDISLNRLPEILTGLKSRFAIVFPDKAVTDILGLEAVLSRLISQYKGKTDEK